MTWEPLQQLHEDVEVLVEKFVAREANAELSAALTRIKNGQRTAPKPYAAVAASAETRQRQDRRNPASENNDAGADRKTANAARDARAARRANQA